MTLMSRLCLSVCFLLIFSQSALAASEAYSMATIDVNRIMNQLDEARAVKEKLDTRTQEARKKIESRGKELKKLEEELKAKKLSPDSEEVEDFREQARDFERMVKDTEEEIRREFLKENQKLTSKVLDAVRSYAKEHDIELVLDKGEAGRGPVIFGDPTADITAAVLAEINK